MTRRAPAEPEYSKQGKPRADTVRERRILQNALASDEGKGAAHRISATLRPYQGVTRPEGSGYLWANWLWGEPPAPARHRRARRAR